MACNIECRDCSVVKDLPHSAIQLYQDFIPFLTDGLRPGNEVADEEDAEPIQEPEPKVR